MILEFLLPKFVIVFVSVIFGRHKNTLLHLSFYVQRCTFLIKWTQGLVMPFPLGADDDVCLVGAHRLLPLWVESASGLSAWIRLASSYEVVSVAPAQVWDFSSFSPCTCSIFPVSASYSNAASILSSDLTTA